MDEIKSNPEICMDESTVQYFYSDLIYNIEQRKKINLQI